MRFAPLTVGVPCLGTLIALPFVFGDDGGGGGNLPPVCNAGSVHILECNGQMTTVQLDGTGSFDPDGDPLVYAWTIQCPEGSLDDPSSPTPILTIDMTGQCEVECGAIRLSVFDGQATTSCTTAALVTDTTPPTISCPPDVLELWDDTIGGYPAQVAPGIQGFATASDICDPNATPFIADDSVAFGGPPQGLEVVVTRTWEVTDCTGGVAQCTQQISLVGPSYFNDTQPMDVGPGSCPNYVSLSGASPDLVEVVVFGTDAVNVANLDSFHLTRLGDLGYGLRPVQVVAGDFGAPVGPGPCHSEEVDEQLDLKLSFDRADLVRAFGLDAEVEDTMVGVELRGRYAIGGEYRARDLIQIAQ